MIFSLFGKTLLKFGFVFQQYYLYKKKQKMY